MIDWRKPAFGGIIPFISQDTQILEAVQHGDPKAADELLPLVYGELRKLAASKMANEAANNTLQPTALVHEAWLRLVRDGNPKFANRAHFFTAAAEAMRRILIDRARRKRAVRHGGGASSEWTWRDSRLPRPSRRTNSSSWTKRWTSSPRTIRHRPNW